MPYGAIHLKYQLSGGKRDLLNMGSSFLVCHEEQQGLEVINHIFENISNFLENSQFFQNSSKISLNYDNFKMNQIKSFNFFNSIF